MGKIGFWMVRSSLVLGLVVRMTVGVSEVKMVRIGKLIRRKNLMMQKKRMTMVEMKMQGITKWRILMALTRRIELMNLMRGMMLLKMMMAVFGEKDGVRRGIQRNL
uniref:Uncharacterized protein n=1 Tax=Picea sitchensis TaxID=3332 RepID=A9NTK3_PICSI|nr:unknown [Picea sitchensis]